LRAGALSLVVFCAALAACTPELDWRELSVREGRLAVLLPGKPHSDSWPAKANYLHHGFLLPNVRVDPRSPLLRASACKRKLGCLFCDSWANSWSWRPEKHSFDAQVFVNVGPVETHT